MTRVIVFQPHMFTLTYILYIMHRHLNLIATAISLCLLFLVPVISVDQATSLAMAK